MNDKYIYGCSPIKGEDGKYHYTYRITNIVDGKHYYGVRTSTKNPYDDLGTKYFSSSDILKPILKLNTQHFKFKIIACFKTRQAANEHEVKLLMPHGVSKNDNFYNRALKTSRGWNTSGLTAVKDADGNTIQVSKHDPRIKNGELQGVTKGLIWINNGSEMKRIAHADNIPDGWSRGHIKGNNKNRVIVSDVDGNRYSVFKDDPRYLSGELKSIFKNTVNVRSSCGNTMQVSKDDPRYLSGELVALSKGRTINKDTISVVDAHGNNFRVHRNDPRYLSGELISSRTNKIYINDGSKNKFIDKSSSIPEGWYRGRLRAK